MSKSFHDFSTRLQVAVESVKADRSYKNAKAIDALVQRIAAKLRKLGSGKLNEADARKLRELLRDVRREVTDTLAREIDVTLQNGQQLSFWTAEKETSFIRKVTKQKLTDVARDKLIKRVVERPLQVNGQLLEPFLRDWSARQTTQVEGIIRLAWSNGDTVDATVKKLLGTSARKQKDGHASVMKRQSEAVVRTAMQHMATAARVEVYRENDHVVSGYQFVATLDQFTTVVCRHLDGEKYTVDNGPVPPMHIGCRSTTIPELAEEFAFLTEGETRSSVDGQVNARLSYYEWIKSQDADYQDEVLGKRWAEIFRGPGMTVKRFKLLRLDKTFKPRTLKEAEVLLVDKLG